MWIKIRRFSQNGRIKKKKEKKNIFYFPSHTEPKNIYIYKNTNQIFVCV